MDDLNTTHLDQINEIKRELAQTKEDVRALKLVLGSGGTQFDDAPANATAE